MLNLLLKRVNFLTMLDLTYVALRMEVEQLLGTQVDAAMVLYALEVLQGFGKTLRARLDATILVEVTVEGRVSKCQVRKALHILCNCLACSRVRPIKLGVGLTDRG